MRSKRPARSTKNQPTDESTAKKKKLVEQADISDDPVNRDFEMNNIQSAIDENVNQKSVVSQINQDKDTTDSNTKKVSLILES